MLHKIALNIPIIAFVVLSSVQAHAGATAMARVTANIVPAVSASVSGSVMLQAVENKTRNNNQALAGSSISLETPQTNKPAQLKVRNTGNFEYVVTVSPVVNSAAKNMVIHNYALPQINASHSSKEAQQLNMKASLKTDNNNRKGAYNGSVYITANFN